MRPNRTLAALWAAALVASGLVVAGPALVAAAESAPIDPGVDATVTADALPTVQIDGVVWAQVVVGNTVYVGGEFTTARPAGSAPGVNTVPRENLLAYDITTGNLLPWAPTANGAVLALAASPDGSRIYVGGNFNRLNGNSRNRFGALSASDGGTLSTFNSGSNGQVRGIAVTNSSVFIAGTFNTVGGQSRPRIAAFDSQTGALRPFRADVQSRQIDGIAASPDGQRVYITGRFEKVNGIERLGSAAFNASTAALLPWTFGPEVYNHGTDASINHVQVDERQVYATAFTYFASGTGIGNVEGPFAADPITGDINWIGDCHGDTYGVYLNPGEDHFYVAGHPHMCNNIGEFPEPSRRVHYFATAFTKDRASVVTPNTQGGGYANNEGFGAPAIRNFFPDFTAGTYTGTAQATWNVTGTGDYVSFGGEFTRVNGVPQQGLVRFAKRHLAPGQQGPQLSGSSINIRARSHARGTVQVSWPTNQDRDNEWLTYTVLRGPTNNLQEVYSVTARSRFWNRPRLSFTDTGLSNSTSYTYRVRVTDATGNSVTSSSVNVTTAGASTAPLSDYAKAILDDNPNNYWRLGETSGVMRDWTSFSDATVGSAVQRNQPGAIVGDTDRAAYFNGSSNNSRIYSNNQEYGQDRLSVEAWIRTSSTSGGKIVGFGQTRGTGNSSNHDRHLYMTPDGRIVWGVYPNGVRTVSSTQSYNDNEWHHVVGTLGAAGMRLYVDGVEVAANPDVVAGQASRNGYWRIGGDNLSGWPDTGSNNFVGWIDEVATYGRQLSLADVVRHYGMGTGGEIPNIPPTAAFTATGGVLTASFDASASGDEDGTITSYAWDFGDGQSGSGATVTHPYAAPGTYQVTLTVTDDDGATATATQEVVVEAPNQAPTAAFTWANTHLTASVDAGGSTDPDGSVVSYLWRWGDGSTSTGVTAQHTYATAGTYPVELTVTDDDGATGTVTVDVTVTEPPPAPDVVARDAFSRTVASGWGNADLGGAWVTTSGAGSVALGTGRLTLGSAGAIASARLPGAEGTHVTTSTTVRWDKRPSGNGGYTLLRGRIAAGGEYRFKVNYRSNGQLQGWIARASSTGSETVITPVQTVSGATYDAGTPVNLRMEVAGASPTTIRAKLWTGSTEPSGWQWQVTDSTAGLQVPGHTGVAGMLAPNTTNTPVVVSFDDYRVEVPAGSGPAPNESPEAAFTASTSGLTVSVDGSGSSDPDGTISTYAWDFGDGETASGVSAEHTYALAGTYTVRLTVTDDDGASDSTTRQVTVTAPDPGPGPEPEPPGDGVVGADAFSRTVGSGWGTADTGGAWVTTSGAGSVQAGVGRLQLGSAGSIASARLPGAEGTELTTSTTVSWDKRPSGSGGYTLLRGRIAAGGEYRFKVNYRSNGQLQGWIARANASGSETVIAGTQTVAGATYAAGTPVRLKFEVTGTSPTLLRAKVWTGGTEPAGWQWQTTDSTAGLQVPGHTGVAGMLAPNTTNAPAVVSFDDFLVEGPVTEAAPEPEAPEPGPGDEPGDPGDEPGDPGDPGDEPGDPGDEPGDPGDEPGDPGDEPGDPGDPGDEPGDPGDEPGDPGDEQEPGPVAVGADQFARTVGSGWGTAEIGGPWVTTAGAAAVVPGAGRLTLSSAGAIAAARLPGIEETDLTTTATVVWDKRPSGSGGYTLLRGRITPGGEYRFKLNFRSNGTVTGWVARSNAAGSETIIAATQTASGVTYEAGTPVHMKIDVTGTSPTTIRAKVWTGDTEPEEWQWQVTDSNPGHQVAGHAGVAGMLAPNTTNVPVVASFTRFLATRPAP